MNIPFFPKREEQRFPLVPISLPLDFILLIDKSGEISGGWVPHVVEPNKQSIPIITEPSRK